MNISGYRLLQEIEWNRACTSSCHFRTPLFHAEYKHGALLCELSYTTADASCSTREKPSSTVPPPMWRIVRKYIAVWVVGMCDVHKLFHVHTTDCPTLTAAAMTALEAEVACTPQYRNYQHGLQAAQTHQQVHNERIQLTNFIQATKVSIMLHVKPKSEWGSQMQQYMQKGNCSLAAHTRNSDFVCPVTGSVLEEQITYSAASLPTGVWFNRYMNADKDTDAVYANMDLTSACNMEEVVDGAYMDVTAATEDALLEKYDIDAVGGAESGMGDAEACTPALATVATVATTLHQHKSSVHAAPNTLSARCRIGSKNDGAKLMDRIRKSLTTILFGCDNGRVPVWVKNSGTKAREDIHAIAALYKNEVGIPICDLLSTYSHAVSYVGVYGEECNLARITYYATLICQIGAIVAHHRREQGGLCVACTTRLSEDTMCIPVWCPGNQLLQKIIVGVLTIMATTGFASYGISGIYPGDPVAHTRGTLAAGTPQKSGKATSTGAGPGKGMAVQTHADKYGRWGDDTGVRYVLPRDLFIGNIIMPMFNKKTQNERAKRGQLQFSQKLGVEGQNVVRKALEYTVENSQRDSELGIVSKYLLQCLARTVTWFDANQLEKEARDMGAL